MDKENWKKIEAIYDQAVLLDIGKQESFVKQQVANNLQVYQQVMKMLNTETQGFMQAFPGDIAGLNEFGSIDLTKLGHFTIIKKIATGGMGRVYLAQSSRADVPIKVALKTIRIELINDELKRKFQNEKNILSKLQHKNIASLIDAGVTENQIPYIATEWVNGENIKDYCIQNKLNIKQRLNLFLQICDAMTFAHNKLIIHRDLKPDNILVNDQKQVKLLDFGIAKIVDENQNAQTHTQIFTPDYAAPEQLNGDMCTAATDIYSLGIILFEILTNSKRFNLAGLAITEKIKAIALPKLTDLSDVQPEHQLVYSVSNLKGTLYTIINKAMHVDPNRRYNSVTALATDIESYLENRPIKAMNDNFFYKTKMLLLRNKLASGFLLLAFVGTISGLIIANNQLLLKETEANKSKIMLDFFKGVMATASPVQGGTLNMPVREMFEKGLENFDIDQIEDSYIKAEISQTIGLLYSEIELEEESVRYYQIAATYYENNLSKVDNASAYIQNAMYLAGKLINNGQADKAKDYIDESISKVKGYSVLPNQMGLAYISLGRIYGIAGAYFDKVKAFEYYDKAEFLINKMPDDENKKHSLLGEIYFYKQMHFYATNTSDEAFEYLNKAEFYFNKSIDSQYNANLNTVMSSKASLFGRIGQYQKAEQYFDKANQGYYKMYLKYAYVILINQANNYSKMGKFNKALENLNIAENMFKQRNESKNINYYGLLLNKTNALVGLQQYDQVQTNFDEILEFMHNLLPADHYIIKTVINDQAAFNLRLGIGTKIAHSKKSLINILDNETVKSPLKETVKLSSAINLANIYLYEKDYESALKYFQLGNALTKNEVEKHNQGWFYWQLQTGFQLSKIKQGNFIDIEKFKTAKKRLLEMISDDEWFDSFFSN